MASSAPAEGTAALRVASVAGRSRVVRCWSRTPLRLLIPGRARDSVWAYTSSFGGGMVAGDRTALQVEVDAGARCFLGSQSSSKIYRNPAGLPCAHSLEAKVAEGALLVVAPDPVQCFADSSYEQTQRFDLALRASLVLVDWFSGGRTARGEQWQFNSYTSRNEVWREGKLIWLDPLRLDRTDGPPRGAHLDTAPVRSSALTRSGSFPAPDRVNAELPTVSRDRSGAVPGCAPPRSEFVTGRFHCFATMCLLGPHLAVPAQRLLEALAASPIERGSALMIAGSPLREGAILRFAATSVEAAARAIQARLAFLRELLSDNPWERKW